MRGELQGELRGCEVRGLKVKYCDYDPEFYLGSPFTSRHSSIQEFVGSDMAVRVNGS